MASRLKMVNVHLLNKGFCKDTKIASSSDVAFLFAKEFKSYNNDTVGIININATGFPINIKISTLDFFEANTRQNIEASVLSNAARTIIICKCQDERFCKAINNYQIASELVGIEILDAIQIREDGYKSFKSAGLMDDLKHEIKSTIKTSISKINLKDDKNDDFIRIKLNTERFINNDLGKKDINVHDTIDMAKGELRNLDRECVLIISIKENKPINGSVVSIGDISSSTVHPRELFKVPILSNADSIILMHNHPSGNAKPSDDDKRTTKRVMDVGNILGIDVKDHIIVGALNEDICSLRDEGIMHNNSQVQVAQNKKRSAR